VGRRRVVTLWRFANGFVLTRYLACNPETAMGSMARHELGQDSDAGNPLPI
jgi:hypothetical protein